MYMRNRYYDPAKGQFTQADPIGLAGGMNVYGFAAGDPVSYSDPYGLCPYGDGEHNTDTSDCPDDDAGNAVRLIDQHGGATGEMIISGMAAGGLTPVLRSPQEILRECGAEATACQTGAVLNVQAGQGLAELAADITHEAGHGIITDTMDPNQQLMYEQPIVESWAMEVFIGIPAEFRSARGGRAPFVREYTQNPEQFRRNIASGTCDYIRRVRGGTCE